MQYWPNENLDGRYAIGGFALNMRGAIALHLVEKWGTVAGEIADKEDSAGRAVLDVMPPADVVERAFTLADLTVNELEKREWIRSVECTPEELGEKLGTMEAARDSKRYDGLSRRAVPAAAKSDTTSAPSTNE